jgi:hypothetical protein
MSASAWSGEAVQVGSVRAQAHGHTLRIRATERGEFCDAFAACRVWTVHEGEAVEDGRVMRKEADGNHSYALCNAAVETPWAQLAQWKCQRYFIERSNQEAKSELGWDENSRRRNTAPGNIIWP